MDVKHIDWAHLKDGYRNQYNQLPFLDQYHSGQITLKQLLAEFWANLHHQGDVDTAAYAVVPILAKYYKERRDNTGELLSFLATVIIAAQAGTNPRPEEEIKRYFEIALEDLSFSIQESLLQPQPPEELWAGCALIALRQGQLSTAKLLNYLDKDTVEYLVSEYV